MPRPIKPAAPAAAARPVKRAARKRDRRETEERLFRAGVEVMSALGYEGATTRRIADAAGVNEQLLTRYFGGKQGLLVAILDRYSVTETDRELAARPRVADSLRDEIRAFLEEADFSADSEPFARLVLAQAPIDARVAGSLNTLRVDCYRPLLRERLEAHRQRGHIDESCDLDEITDALIHLRLGLAAYGRLLFGLGSPALQRLFESAATVIARGLAFRES